MRKTPIVELYIRNLTFVSFFFFDYIDYHNFLSLIIPVCYYHYGNILVPNDNYIYISFSLSTIRDTELFV